MVKANEKIKSVDETSRAANLKRCVDKLTEDDADPDFEIGKGLECSHPESGLNLVLPFAAKSDGSAVWMATLEVVRAVSAVLVHTVPEFWKICRGYKEGKYRRVSHLTYRITAHSAKVTFLLSRKTSQ